MANRRPFSNVDNVLLALRTGREGPLNPTDDLPPYPMANDNNTTPRTAKASTRIHNWR